MDTEILYADNYIVCCVKPAGVISEDGGLPELLKEKLGGSIWCIHRLDKAVGGVMVYARDKKAAAKLSAMAAGTELGKQYLAAVYGTPEEKGIYSDLLFHDSAKNKTYVVRSQRGGVKSAELEFAKLETVEIQQGSISLVRVKLHTGRTHQIRVQFASRKMPLIGDKKYGSRIEASNIALWSEQISFIHPMTGKEICVSAKPPKEWPWSKFYIE